MCSVLEWMKVHVWQGVCSHAVPFSAPTHGPSVCVQHWGAMQVKV